jgi:hypothetical protein
MRKIALLFSLLLLLTLNLSAGTVANVTLPDTVQAGNTTLLLNGMGMRTKYLVKVYVAGLYVAQKSSEPAAILKADAPKRIVMHFVRDVNKSQLTVGFTDSFNDNTPDAAKRMKSEIDRFFAALDAVKDGEELVFTYIPGTGTTFAEAGKDKLTIADAAFAEMLFSVWLGPKPPNANLKKGLLGQ